MAHKKGPYNKEELAYLKENYLIKTDQELSIEMNRHPHGIYMVRKKRGWVKSQNGKRISKKVLEGEDLMKKINPDYVSPIDSLSLDQRKNLFLNFAIPSAKITLFTFPNSSNCSLGINIGLLCLYNTLVGFFLSKTKNEGEYFRSLSAEL